MKLEIKTTFISAIDIRQVNMHFVLSHPQWETRRDKAHGLLVWVEPLEVAFLLLSPIGGLLPGLTSDDPSTEELRQAQAQASQPFTKVCSDLGGGCAWDMGFPTALTGQHHPHIAAVCPKALRTAGCPLPGAPLCANLHIRKKHGVWDFHVGKALNYMDNADHLLRRLISAFVMVGFRPAIYIDVGPVWAAV